jgi:Kef-type K+ transport system membrane component KefB
MELTWGIAAVWLGLALVASLLSIRFKLSVALVEILVGLAAGNLVLLAEHYRVQLVTHPPQGPVIGNLVLWLEHCHVIDHPWELKPNEWIAFLAGFGSILLTFMAGAEIEPALLRKYFKATFAIGIAGFVGPFIGATLYAHFISHWDWNAALICGIALSTTSVAVVYAVMIETGLNETELGKIILAACFINDLGTVIALGACFASYNWTLALFAVVAVAVLWVAPRFVGWFLNRFSAHVSEPGVKFIFFVLFALGALAALANSEAVLPAYLVGLGLAGVFARHRDTVRRLRTTVFALLTPFYFLNAGMKVYLPALWAGLGLIVILLAVKMATKVVGVWPMTGCSRLIRSNYAAFA